MGNINNQSHNKDNMNHTRIALVQMQSDSNPDKNIAIIAQASTRAARAGATMVFLPEMSVLLDKDRARSQRWMTRESDSLWPEQLAAIAIGNRLWLHSGSLPFLSDVSSDVSSDAPPAASVDRANIASSTKSSDKRVNRSLLFSDQGDLVGRYDKLHLFDVDLPNGESWRESSLYRAGTKIITVDTPAGRLGFTICFDLRFPELFQTLVQQNATIIAVPAAFTVPSGSAHWHSLLRARAIETACYIIASAQSGQHTDGRRSYGHSLVIDPWGRVLVDLQQGVDKQGFRIGYADIDNSAIVTARTAIPLDKARVARRVRFDR